MIKLWRYFSSSQSQAYFCGILIGWGCASWQTYLGIPVLVIGVFWYFRVPIEPPS